MQSEREQDLNLISQRDLLENIIINGIEELNKKKYVTFKSSVIYDNQNQQKIRKWNEENQNKKKGRFDAYQIKRLIMSFVKEAQKLNLQIQELEKILQEPSYKKFNVKHKLWSKICSSIPNRTLNSCFKHIKRSFSKCNHRGKWDNEETQKMLNLVEVHGKKWSVIAKYLDRTAENVRDRYRTIGQTNYGQIIKDNWLIEELINLLLEVEKQLSIQFIYKEKMEQSLRNTEHHNKIDIEERNSRKYNSKQFKFHNMNLILSIIKQQQIGNINFSKIDWNQIASKVKSKTANCCRIKLFQICKQFFRANPQNNVRNIDVLNFISTYVKQNEDKIKWDEWSHQSMSMNEGYQRWIIMRNSIVNRSQKTINDIAEEARERCLKSL